MENRLKDLIIIQSIKASVDSQKSSMTLQFPIPNQVNNNLRHDADTTMDFPSTQ